MGRNTAFYRDFSGGLSEAANDNMADNQLVQAQNIMPGDGFGLERAAGTEILYPQLPAEDYYCRPLELIRLTLADGKVQTLVFARYPGLPQDRCRLYRLAMDGQGWIQVATDLPLIRDWFIHSHQLCWLTGAAIKRYDGAVVSDLALTPAAASATAEEIAVWNKVKTAVAVEQRGQRWFYATPGSELIFSEIGDPARVDATSIININTRNEDGITALKEFNAGLLIFKQRSVHYLTGWDFASGSDIVLARLNVTCGTAFPRSVQGVENAVLYLGANGLYRLRPTAYDTVVAAAQISENKISRALWADGPPEEAFAAVWDNVYYLTVRAAGGDSVREFRYLPGLDAFFGPFTQEPTCYALLPDGGLALGVTNGRLLRYSRHSRHYIDPDSGQAAAIPVRAVTKGFDVAGQMVREVRVRQALVAARQYQQEGSHLSLRIKADYADLQFAIDLVDLDESLVWDEGLWGSVYWGWQDTVTKLVEVNKKARRVAFYLSDDHVDEPLLIYGLALVFRRRQVSGLRTGVSRQNVDYQSD